MQSRWAEAPARMFAELMVAYLKATEGERRSEAKVRRHARRLRTYFGGLEMNRLSPAQVREYIGKRRTQRVTNATINRELEVLSAAINYANREWQLPNPVSGRKLREPEGRVRWISPAEAGSLIRGRHFPAPLFHFIEECRRLRRDVRVSLGIDEQWVGEALLQIYAAAMGAEVLRDKEGKILGDQDGNPIRGEPHDAPSPNL